MGSRSLDGTPRMRAYSSAAGRPLISLTMRREGSASVTTSISSVGTKCCVLNVLNGRGVLARTRTALSEKKRPSRVHVRAAEAEAVAGRTADHRDLAQSLLQRVRQQLLAHRQPVDEQKGEGVVAVGSGARPSSPVAASPARRPGRRRSRTAADARCARSRPCRRPRRSSPRRCCDRGNRRARSPPPSCSPRPGRRRTGALISAASTSRSYSLEQKKMTNAMSGCATPAWNSSAATRGSAAHDCAMRMVLPTSHLASFRRLRRLPRFLLCTADSSPTHSHTPQVSPAMHAESLTRERL